MGRRVTDMQLHVTRYTGDTKRRCPECGKPYDMVRERYDHPDCEKNPVLVYQHIAEREERQVHVVEKARIPWANTTEWADVDAVAVVSVDTGVDTDDMC